MIIDMQRGMVRVKLGDKTVTIEGEAYLRGLGSPDFVAYSNSIEHWDPPSQNLKISDAERLQILEVLKTCMAEKNLSLEIE
jgi:hypothetical protein